MYCKNCGNEISDNAFVCPKCGVKVKEEPVTVASPANASGAAASSSSSSSTTTVIIDGKSNEGGLFLPVTSLLCYIFLYPIGLILNIVGFFTGERKGCFWSLFIVFFLIPLIAVIIFLLAAASIADIDETDEAEIQAISQVLQAD